jgi:hypothetical protein
MFSDNPPGKLFLDHPVMGIIQGTLLKEENYVFSYMP